MKYIIYIDYRADQRKTIEYMGLNATTAEDVICEAEEIYNPETMYLVRIMKKVGKIEKVNSEWKKELYEAILCKRSPEGGWHKNDFDHSENYHTAAKMFCKDLVYYETEELFYC